MNDKKITTHKLLGRFFREKLPKDITHHISKFVGKYLKIKIPKRWVRLKLPREKRLIRIFY
jgi:hypothetical protein